jgi:hypothetical protein
MKSKEATIRRNLDAEERVNRNREINERVLMGNFIFNRNLIRRKINSNSNNKKSLEILSRIER